MSFEVVDWDAGYLKCCGQSFCEGGANQQRPREAWPLGVGNGIYGLDRLATVGKHGAQQRYGAADVVA